MASGIYLLGKNGLSMKDFNEHVRLALGNKGYRIDNYLLVNTGERRSTKSVLTSIVGDGNLEKGVSNVLVKLGERISEEEKRMGKIVKEAFSYQLSDFSHLDGKGKCVNEGSFMVIGTFEDNETASKLFPVLAQGYLIKSLEARVDEVSYKISDLMGKKLSDLR